MGTSSSPNDMSPRLMPRLRFQTLFGMLVLMLLFPDGTFEGALGRIVGISLSTLVLFAALYGFGHDRRRLIIGALLGVPFVVMHLVRAFSADRGPDGLSAVVSLVFLAYVTWTVVFDLLGHDEVFGDAIFAAACAYLLIAYTWGAAYVTVDLLQPGSFRSPTGTGSLSVDDATYFSLVTLTTLGYGDIAPIGTFARRLATLESVTGVLYIAIVVSRLVSIVRRHRTDEAA